MSSPLLDLSGAIEADGLGVPMHYGAPIAEQRALDDGLAVVDLSHYGIVTVAGQDRLSWLNSMTSQQLIGLRAGESTETLLLDANGRIEQAIGVVEDGERCWLIVDAGSAEALFAFLNRMRFALRVEVADVSAEYAVVGAFEGVAAEALRALEPVAEWRDPWFEVGRGGVQYAAEHPAADWSAVQFVIPRADLGRVAELVRSGSIRAAGLLALDALQVRAARPTRHGEVDERSIPHEFDWLRSAVHMNKGCYRGQETVAKVHNLGHPPRRLALLHLDGSAGELPASGSLVYVAGQGADARPVGRITRAAMHHEWGAIALVLLKRSVAEDAVLEVRPEGAGEAIAASQEVIVPSEAGATNRGRIAAQFSARRP